MIKLEKYFWEIKQDLPHSLVEKIKWMNKCKEHRIVQGSRNHLIMLSFLLVVLTVSLSLLVKLISEWNSR